MKRFIKFIIGGILVVGSILFGITLLFSLPFALIGDMGDSVIILGFIDLIALLSGIYLMRP